MVAKGGGGLNYKFLLAPSFFQIVIVDFRGRFFGESKEERGTD